MLLKYLERSWQLMRICSLVSGSSGNATYIEGNRQAILVDAGLTKKALEEQLYSMDRKPQDLSGILITHEHTDHVKGLGVIARKYQIPIYISSLTASKVLQIKSLGNIEDSLIVRIEKNQKFQIGDLEVLAIPVSHDAIDPLMYRINEGNKSCGICMDLGTYDESTIESFRGINALVLEANYDKRMLEVGPYPYDLKRRILGSKGHLSNELSGQLLDQLLHPYLEGVLLGHLSKDNNYEALALETVKSEIDLSQSEYRSKEFDIRVAPRESRSHIIEIS